ncbi:MAG TPA: S-layer homology domain-containing protein, partial [Candidatus Peribacteria bacterium]|nr:S-layer homology domain-containing protein [Candidatus Peribacteria bacterium]
ADFAQNKVISVVINGQDLHVAPNVMSAVSYSFTTVDSDAPTFASFVPAQSASNVAADTNVSFHILDSAGGAGVDINNTTVTVAGTPYTSASPQFGYTGTSSDYTVTINPSSNFSGGQVVTVAISTRDLASTPNTASTSYSFTIASTCSTCFVDSENPARFDVAASLTNTITFRVKDTGDGINPNTITVTLIGTGAAFPVSPLTITGASAAMDVTGTAANELVTITLPATTEVNIPYSIYITASNVNGLAMAPVGYTVATIAGSGSIIIHDTPSCPAVQQCTASSEQANGGNNRGNGNTVRNIDPEDVPGIIADRQIPQDGGTQVVDNGTPGHTAAPLTPYTDIAPGAWYESAVKEFLDLGILDATKTTFRGDDSAIRAEFAKVIAKLGKLDENAEIPDTPTFDDVQKADWFFPFIEMVAQKGIMKGYGECIGTHPCDTMPAAIISRAEAAAMIVRYYKLSSTMDAPHFDDVASDAWYADIMQAAADHCVIQGRQGSATARPADPINRAEMIVMLQRAIKQLEYSSDCPWGGTLGNTSSSVKDVSVSSAAAQTSSSAASSIAAATSSSLRASSASASATTQASSATSVASSAAATSSSLNAASSASDASSSVAQSSSSSSVHPAAGDATLPDWLFPIILAATLIAIFTIGVRIFVLR